jgi:hypothetical protein
VADSTPSPAPWFACAFQEASTCSLVIEVASVARQARDRLVVSTLMSPRLAAVLVSSGAIVPLGCVTKERCANAACTAP